MKRRRGPTRERHTDQYSATRVWRSNRAWHPHFRRVPPASANLRQQIEPASGTGRQRVGLPGGSYHASRRLLEKDSNSAPSCPRPSPNVGSKQRDVRFPKPEGPSTPSRNRGSPQQK